MPSEGEAIDASAQGNEGKLELRAALVPRLNLADFQNAVPAVRELAVSNNTDAALRDLDLTVSSAPAFLKPRIWHLDVVGVGQTLHLKDLDLQLDGALLSRLTEAEKSTVAFRLTRREQPEVVLCTLEVVVELLPRNHWAGIGHMPEMAAAFVQPNDPAVEHVLKAAAGVLHRAGKSGAIDGYKHGAKRAWELSSAVWGAVVAMRLDYSLPPASFEHTGQKVRGPSQVAESGLATCMDLALLFAACLEQAHLNPLIVFLKGHAFVGLWLRPEEFSTTVVDDVTALRKRVKLNELILFETTLVTHRPAASFSQACENAVKQIAEEHQDAFELAVDVRRARMTRIKPLASAEVAVAKPAAELPEDTTPAFEEAPDLPDDGSQMVPSAQLDPKDRLARWQRKLLDLSLRNSLLNFKAGKKALTLEAPDPGALEDLLAEGQALKLLAHPDLMDGADPRSKALHEARENEDVRQEHAREALGKREVFIRLAAPEMEARLIDLYRGARNAMQEGGANTMFLALGFLVWNRDDKPGQRIKAPLILLPVTLNRKSARSGFTVTAHEDEPRFNPTLLEMLRQDFKLDLGVGDGELPRDDTGVDVAAIWRRVAHAIKDVKGWEVSEDVVLSVFSFAKFLMWKDLTERTEQLRQNPVVKHLIDTPREAYASSMPFPEARRLDAEFSPQQTFCPLPADSSQLSAVMAAVKGKDFVLIGPPGTGKSQTISNLIAQCLAEGKRVLFVAEKIAALDVVYRRLREVGLGEFCLELHSNKARKLDVLAQLAKSWDAQGSVDQVAWQAEAQRLKKIRDELSAYVERLHHRHANGWTIYGAIGRVVGGNALPQLKFSWPSLAGQDEQEMARLRDIADRLEVNSTAVGPQALSSGALVPIGRSEWSPKWQQLAVEAAEAVAKAAQGLAAAYSRFAAVVGLPACGLERHARGAICVLAKALPSAHGHDWGFLLAPESAATCVELKSAAGLVTRHHQINAEMSAPWTVEQSAALVAALRLLEEREEVRGQLGAPWAAHTAEELSQGLQLLEQIEACRAQLSVKYTSQVEALNVSQLQREWAKAEGAIWPLSWLRKRKVRTQLESVIEGAGEPKVAEDLASWVAMRALRDQVSDVNLGASLQEVWVGLKTRSDVARSALRANSCLEAACAGRTWEDAGLEVAAQGRCGERWSAEVARLRRLRALDADIAARADQLVFSDGLWQGHTTRRDLLVAAMAFERERLALSGSGELLSEHTEVAQGQCGARLQAEHSRMTQRAAVEQALLAHGGLAERTLHLWQGLATDLGLVDRALKFHSPLHEAVTGLAQRGQDAAEIQTALRLLISDKNQLLAPGAAVAIAGAEYLEAWAQLSPSIDRLAEIGTFAEPTKQEWLSVGVSDLIERSLQIVGQQAGMRAWCAWRKVREEAIAAGLCSLVSAIETGALSGKDIQAAFEVNYCRWWLSTVVEDEVVIRTFTSAEHERRIGDFRALDDKFTDITRQWIRARLCADLPSVESVNKNTEWGVLRHEVNKKKRHLPLRELLSRIPSVVLRLTPCLLMSPLSIAQYLSADASNFDVVVFDEASQIPVWDAIGAMARGRQVVMVGDPRQLPPTNFFERAEADADDEDVEGDLESILDECLGASLPTRNLNWHYRSRHESLIAFSNSRYYGGSLVTFPSPFTDDRAVSFHHIKGVYEKGGARINKSEAKALVADLVRRLKSPGFRESKLTIGVVTFNTEQQALIEDLLDEARRSDPSIEPFFAEVELEPVFVKNLESVQGDERDIMYFSITYGPDASGAVSMNFGPLNRDGGERRLNVAVTRARHELRVFSSLKGEQMDLSRTQALGVRDLKHFLEFAERGPRALAEATMGSRGDFESPFEEAVATALSRKGWQVHTQIGASAFRVDLGVVHPDMPGRYLTGVECDGATYHRSATARDRDKLREQVLRGLGWEIVRVWSTDWWIDPSGTLERVHSQLDALLEADRQRQAVNDIARAEADAAIVKASSTMAIDGSLPVAPPESAIPVPQDDRNVAIASNGGGAGRAPKAGRELNRFVESDPLEAVSVGQVDAALFFDPGYEEILGAMVRHVVEIEGPILDAVLARKIARAHGFARTGSRIQERVEQRAAGEFATTEEEGVGTFYWPKQMEPGTAVPYRAPLDEGSSRGVEEICIQELVSLAQHIRSQALSDEDAVITMARELGLQRLRAASRGRLESALAAGA
jgi:very-short-patch-repair endonuclease